MTDRIADKLAALNYLSDLADADDDSTEDTRQYALDFLAGRIAETRAEMTPADLATYAYRQMVAHPIVRQLAWDNDGDYDRWGHTMMIGFTICDALTMRGEYVPAELEYRPAGLPDPEDFDTLDAEQAEERWPDHGDLYFAWGLGLGEGMGSIDADELRDYLTGPWQAAYDALKSAGEDY